MSTPTPPRPPSPPRPTTGIDIDQALTFVEEVASLYGVTIDKKKSGDSKYVSEAKTVEEAQVIQKAYRLLMSIKEREPKRPVLVYKDLLVYLSDDKREKEQRKKDGLAFVGMINVQLEPSLRASASAGGKTDEADDLDEVEMGVTRSNPPEEVIPLSKEDTTMSSKDFLEDTTTPSYVSLKKKATDSLMGLSTKTLDAEGKELSQDEFVEGSKKMIDTLRETYEKDIEIHDDLDKKSSLTIKIVRENGKKDTLTQSYDKEKGCAKVSLTNPPDDVSINIMLQASAHIVPLTMTHPCKNPNTALRLYEASILSGIKIVLHEKDEALLKENPHFKLLSQIKDEPAALTKFRALVKSDPERKLGTPIPEPIHTVLQEMVSKTIRFEGPKP